MSKVSLSSRCRTGLMSILFLVILWVFGLLMYFFWNNFTATNLLATLIFFGPFVGFVLLTHFTACFASAENLMDLSIVGMLRYFICSILSNWVGYAIIISIWTQIPYDFMNPAASDMLSPPMIFTAFDSIGHFFYYYIFVGIIFSLVLTLAMMMLMVMLAFLKRIMGSFSACFIFRVFRHKP